MSLKTVCGNIVKMRVDVIVNAANNELKWGGGVCDTIFKAAGAKALQKKCDSIGYCETGNAVITSSGKLHAKYIIHTVGPVYTGGNSGEADFLKSCYANSLEMAKQHDCKSIAFPIISSGIYGYPIGEAVDIAVRAMQEFLDGTDMEVVLVFYKKTEFKRFGNVKLFA